MHPDHWFIIVNPMAGGSRLKTEWPKIEAQLTQAGLAFTYEFTKSKGHATELAHSAIKQGYLKIAGVGGDGTNNEIVNGIFTQTYSPIVDICYSLLPFGTGNDWSRTHKIPQKVAIWVKMIKTNHQINHNVGVLELKKEEKVSKRFFINIAGMAYDAHIVKMGEQYPQKSRRKLLYLWLVVRWLWSYTSPRLQADFNNESRKERFYTINCGICQYAGGGMKIVPHANPESSAFGITMIKDFPKWKVPFDIPKLFTGKLQGHKYTTMVHCDKINITPLAQDVLEIELDGEYIGSGEVEISLHDKRLKVIVPKLVRKYT